ncbi:hypothetical protein NMD51_20625 [Escherichia coli]|uniref:hypothetical protein n=1 Tax=Escherichia coli TaxID=562 RepID=UPI002FBEC9F7
MLTRQQSGLFPCKTSPAAARYPTMTSAHGAGISATGPVNSACADCLWLTASGPHCDGYAQSCPQLHLTAQSAELTRR